MSAVLLVTFASAFCVTRHPIPQLTADGYQREGYSNIQA
jgi:hypothetical protein